MTDMDKLGKSIKDATDKYDKFMANMRFGTVTGWRRFVSYFGSYSWARRLLGGKWELWVHDMGTVQAVISWHWVFDWSDTILKGTEHVVAKRWYVNGNSLDSTRALLREYDERDAKRLAQTMKGVENGKGTSTSPQGH